MPQPRILHLSLSKLPFDVMESSEKPNEYRKPSDWIKSRMYDKNGKKKCYDLVKFVNGYGKTKPYFIAEYKRFSLAQFGSIHTYSNGLVVNVEIGDFVIVLGKIIERGNLQ